MSSGVKCEIIDSPNSSERDGDNFPAILVPGKALVQTMALAILKLRMEAGFL